MNLHLMEQMASQHNAELRALHTQDRYTQDRCTQHGHTQSSHAAADRIRQGQQDGQAAAHRGHGHVIRRRAGWALISLGLRLAYAAGQD